MIFVSDKIYMKVWKVFKSDKYLDLQCSTSEKSSDGTTRVYSHWRPRIIGKAFNTLKDTIKEGDFLLVTRAKLTNESYTAKDGNKKDFFKLIILDAEINNNGQTPSNAPAAKPAPEPANDTEDPW